MAAASPQFAADQSGDLPASIRAALELRRSEWPKAEINKAVEIRIKPSPFCKKNAVWMTTDILASPPPTSPASFTSRSPPALP